MANYQDIIANYKDKKGGIIEAYHALQREFNYIPQKAVAEAARVFGVSEALGLWSGYFIPTFR